MSELPPRVEQGPEKMPSESDIKAVFERLTGGKEFKESRKCEDEAGVYLWEISKTNEDDEVTEYSYMRAGEHKEGSSKETVVHAVFYDADGIPVGGHDVAKWKDGSWIETE